MGARWFLPLLVVVAFAGCGGGAAVDRTSESSCATSHPARNPSDTLTVVLFDTVDLSHAPWGRNREERFVFSHLYETLVTVDCHGKIQPALAKSIQEGSDGWLITLRDDAYFWDDEPVSSFEVVESFKPAIRNGLAIKSVAAIDERTVLVQGYDGRPDAKLLALPMVSITKPGPMIPIGTGAWMIDEGMPVAESVVIRPVDAIAPTVRFVQGNASDARDLMSGTADALITDDPAAIEYARAAEHASVVPLAWDRAYMLFSVTRATKLARGESVEELPRATRDALARDAVPIDSWGGSSLVRVAHRFEIEVAMDPRPLPGVLTHDKRVMVDASDPVAGRLAERLVALAAMDTTASSDARAIVRAIPDAGLRPLRVERVSLSALENSRRESNDFAYVVAISTCAEPLATRPTATGFIPLVETRAHFIAIGDRIGFTDDRNGTVCVQVVHVGVKR